MPLENFGACVGSAPGGMVYRGAQPDERGFADLIQMRVQTIIKLNDDMEFSDEKEKELSIGTAILCPLAEVFRWSDKNEDLVLAAVDAIQAGLHKANGTACVYVHCTHGRDRTGLVIAAWRLLFCDYTLEAAMAERQVFHTNKILDLTCDEPDIVLLRKFSGA